MHHLPAALSGGQQQRVAVARAIAAAPPVILADEPTGNLDTRSTKDVMQILHNLKDDGRTVIVITHDNEIAEQAERVIRIESETARLLRITLIPALRRNTAEKQKWIIKTRSILADLWPAVLSLLRKKFRLSNMVCLRMA